MLGLGQCPEGKRPYRSYYSAQRRLNYENKRLHFKGGEIYKCERCGNFHITRDSTKRKFKKLTRG